MSKTRYNPLYTLPRGIEVVGECSTTAITQFHLRDVLEYDPETGVFTWLVSCKWNRKGKVAGCMHTGKTGYRHIFIRIDNRLYKAHRLAWLYVTGRWPVNEIDHIDHDGANNKWLNFREVTRLQNSHNQSKPSDNTSGVVGVCWHKIYNKWVARINVNRKQIFLGCFAEFSEAVSARKEAEIQYGFHSNHGS